MTARVYAANSFPLGQEMLFTGRHYFAMYSALANNAGVIEVRFEAPDTDIGMYIKFDSESALAATVELWIDTTKTHVALNAITPINRNQESERVSGMTICHTPGGAQAGAANTTQYIGAASTNGKVSSGGEFSGEGLWVMKANTAWLVRITSRADLNALSFAIDWYED